MKIRIVLDLEFCHSFGERWVRIYANGEEIGSYDVQFNELGLNSRFNAIVENQVLVKIKAGCRAKVQPRSMLCQTLG